MNAKDQATLLTLLRAAAAALEEGINSLDTPGSYPDFMRAEKHLTSAIHKLETLP